MKKIITLLLGIMIIANCIYAYAESEITFLGVSWLSNEIETIQQYNDKGYICFGVTNASFTKENSTYIEDEGGFYSPVQITGRDEVCYSMNLSGLTKGKIAGYAVKRIIPTFAYDGEYKLISVKVELFNADYYDIKAKLMRVYGDGEQKVTEEGIESIVWKGSNYSAIVLYTQSEGIDFTLIYGRLDATKIINNCLQPDSEDISGL